MHERIVHQITKKSMVVTFYAIFTTFLPQKMENILWTPLLKQLC